MGDAGMQTVLNREMYRLLFGEDAATGGQLTLGEAAARAKAEIPGADVGRTYVLFGDPTMRLR
jgi:hypothetical protein